MARAILGRGLADATAPITGTARQNLEIAASGFEKLLETMHTLIDQDLHKLGAGLEDAGAPWTPGRGLPVWKKK